jgi:hypothetical protein
MIDDHVECCLNDRIYAEKFATFKDTTILTSMILTEEELEGKNFSDGEDNRTI